MKKKFTLIAAFCLLTFIGFSQTTPCPTSFSRNNGNVGGCGSHIVLSFAVCPDPSNIPTLDSVKINGVKQPQTFTLVSIKCSGNNFSIDYCISDINLPPASQLTIYLTYPLGATGGTSGSIICQVASGGPAPVILSSFTVYRNGKNITATWQTQQEINTKGFEVQRAYDNASYQTIATIAGHVNSNIVQSYSYSDNSNTSTSISFYRIKMIDIDGSFSYSDVRYVKGNGEKSAFIVFPNPSFGNAKISISDINEPTNVQLLDNNGRIVKSITLNNGNTIELNNLKTGTYIVKTIGTVTGASSVQKLTVIN